MTGRTHLTPQERDVARYLKEGKCPSTVPGRFGISPVQAERMVDRISEAQQLTIDHSIRAATNQLGAACHAYWHRRLNLERAIS